MTLESAITAIELTYPPDSTTKIDKIIGTALLMKVIQKTEWRDLPDCILIDFAKLCVEEEHTGAMQKMLQHEQTKAHHRH